MSPREGRAYLDGVSLSSSVISETNCDAVTFRTLRELRASLALPLFGSGVTKVGEQQIPWIKNQHFIWANFSQEMELRYEKYTSIIISPEIKRLESTISGAHPELALPDDGVLSVPTSDVDGIQSGIDYFGQILHLLEIIRDCEGDREFLDRIGLEDVIYRTLAELFVSWNALSVRPHVVPRLNRSDRAVDIICDHIMGNVGNPLTLPAMETLTGLTGRSLNYAFQQRFSVSPQQWQRDFLLDAARKRLTSPGELSSIKSIAFDLGFSSSNSFSSFYKKRFGELPSATLSNDKTVSCKAGESL